MTTARIRNDNPDPVTGLTSKEKFLIQESWEFAKDDKDSIGVLVLYHFFEHFPTYVQYFPQFRGIPLQQLGDLSQFKSHCKNIQNSLSSIVCNIDNNEVLIKILTNLGNIHKSKQVPKEAFPNIKGSLMSGLRIFLGSNITDEGYAAWNKAIDVVLSTIMAKMG